uniref:Pentacotripeptide-repeat region of PRORP domain-containing protein n=1 Tax=Amorphochlora amoebiformis TaxID=1561963 RepID=A0A7S0GQ56_9EUKA|mmetsp:Transcript_11252/g.17783  ORF Transcript_11252/g.17783 Transcript_11252/m.17783 type:complete len:460 (+) Transcript_11252:35-1414(+)
MEESFVRKTVVTYNSLISASRDNFDKSMRYFYEMEAAGVRANHVTVQAVLATCSRHSEWEQALHHVVDAKKQKIGLTIQSLNHVIAAICRGGLHKRALTLLHATTLDDYYKGGGWGLRRNEITYGLQMHALTKSREWFAARELFNRITMATLQESAGKNQNLSRENLIFRNKLRQSTLLHNELLETYKTSRDWEGALNAFQWMASRHKQNRRKSGTSVGQGEGSARRHVPGKGGGYSLLEKWPGVRVSDTTYSIMVTVLRKAGEIDRALEIIRKLREMGINEGTIARNAESALYMRSIRWQESLACLYHLLHSPLPSVTPTHHSFFTAIKACNKANLWARSLSLFDTMEKVGVEDNIATVDLFLKTANAMSRAASREAKTTDHNSIHTSMNSSLSSKFGKLDKCDTDKMSEKNFGLKTAGSSFDFETEMAGNGIDLKQDDDIDDDSDDNELEEGLLGYM